MFVVVWYSCFVVVVGCRLISFVVVVVSGLLFVDVCCVLVIWCCLLFVVCVCVLVCCCCLLFVVRWLLLLVCIVACCKFVGWLLFVGVGLPWPVFAGCCYLLFVVKC